LYHVINSKKKASYIGTEGFLNQEQNRKLKKKKKAKKVHITGKKNTVHVQEIEKRKE